MRAVASNIKLPSLLIGATAATLISTTSDSYVHTGVLQQARA